MGSKEKTLHPHSQPSDQPGVRLYQRHFDMQERRRERQRLHDELYDIAIQEEKEAAKAKLWPKTPEKTGPTQQFNHNWPPGHSMSESAGRRLYQDAVRRWQDQSDILEVLWRAELDTHTNHCPSAAGGNASGRLYNEASMRRERLEKRREAAEEADEAKIRSSS